MVEVERVSCGRREAGELPETGDGFVVSERTPLGCEDSMRFEDLPGLFEAFRAEGLGHSG